MSSGWVSKALDEGMPAKRSGRKGDRVEIDTAAAMPWLLDRASKDAAPRADSQRERLAREQADKVALENAVKRRELVPSDQVEAVALELIARIGSALDGVPGRLANELAGTADPSEIRARIAEELRTARITFARGIESMAGLEPGSCAPGRGSVPAEEALAGAVG